MRILFARLLVGITGLLIVGLAIAFAVIRNPKDAARPEAPEQIPVAVSDAEAETPATGVPDTRPDLPAVIRGRSVYAAQRCRACHVLEGEGNPSSPLDGVGARLTEREIRLWIVAPQEMNPEVRKRAYDLPEEDLDALVAYLMASPRR